MVDETKGTEEDVNLAELSDEQIMNLDPEALPEDVEEEDPSAPGKDQEEGEPGDGDDAGDDDEEPGGADSVEDPEDDPDEAGSTSDEEADDTGTADDLPTKEVDEPEADQAPEEDAPKDDKEPEATSETDYKSELDKVMQPFKAANRTVTPKTVDEVRRLMQMGVDYSRKMEAMKPYQKVLKTLERNDLLDIEKVNFLIDLEKKDPAAIKKFLKDGDIDPMDIDLEDSAAYKPTDHAPSDKELAVDAVIDGIRGTESFDRTVKVITEEWDTASRQLLLDEPGAIREINDHVESGLYDMITDRLYNERTFGKYAGLSDLEAYKAVGDAMFEAGEFTDSSNLQATPPATKATQDVQDPEGSSESDDKRKARRKAASPTKGKAATTKKKVPDFAKFSDEQIEAFDIESL